MDFCSGVHPLLPMGAREIGRPVTHLGLFPSQGFYPVGQYRIQ